VGVLGAKILFILENIKETLENGISLGGVSFFGSVFFIPMIMPLVGRMFKLKFGETLDICGPCVAIMIGCLRIGCLMQGCCGGWVMHLESFSFVWPTQLMEFVGDIAILIWLMRFEMLKQMKNLLYPLFMISYSVLRFFIEFLRVKSDLWLGLGHGQWFAILAIVLSVVWIFIKLNNKSTNK
jgi:phosphatidylglycerol:prolipoprotein diacylglycerol transferase